MDLNQAFNVVVNICRNFKGTAQEHEAISHALQAIAKIIPKPAPAPMPEPEDLPKVAANTVPMNRSMRRKMASKKVEQTVKP